MVGSTPTRFRQRRVTSSQIRHDHSLRERLPMKSKPESRVGKWSRRKFLTEVGGGIAAANLAGALAGEGVVAAEGAPSANTLVGASATPQLKVPEAPGRKMGGAVVGLGDLAINE